MGPPWSAFSLRRNVRLLFVPSDPSRLTAVDGLRAIAVLWTALFHAGWYVGGYVVNWTYFTLLDSRWMLALWRGHFGVDLFFVLSGFLIAGLLVDERDRTGRVRFGLFYLRRLMRLWPALLVAIAIGQLSASRHPEMIWAAAIYVNDFVPVLRSEMGWTWSLAIEEQFYLVSPWLIAAVAPLRHPGRVAVIAAVAAAFCFLAAGVVMAGGFHADDTEIVINRDLEVWARGYDALYDKPWMRVGPLLAGVAAAFVYRSRSAMAALDRSRVLGALGFVVALLAAGASTHWQWFDRAPRAVEVVYVSVYRTVFGVSIAYVLLFALSRHPLGARVGRLLSTRALHPVAQLAYAAYLLNPIVCLALGRLVAPGLSGLGPAILWALVPLELAVTFLGAAVVHLFVERPFMELRPRGRAS